MVKIVLTHLSLFLCVVSIASANPRPKERKLYVGSNSSETETKFQATVTFGSASRPSQRLVTEKIEAQVTHLFGPMGEASQKAVPKGDHEIAISKVEKQGSNYVATYQYSGTVVVEKVNGRIPATYKVVLPINPDEIYEQSAVIRNGKKTYPCTDDHYFSEGTFGIFGIPINRVANLKKKNILSGSPPR